MVNELAVSRICYEAEHHRITMERWQNIEALNNQAGRIITGLPKFCILGKRREYAQLNTLHETVVARTVVHGERLQQTWQG